MGMEEARLPAFQSLEELWKKLSETAPALSDFGRRPWALGDGVKKTPPSEFLCVNMKSAISAEAVGSLVISFVYWKALKT